MMRVIIYLYEKVKNLIMASIPIAKVVESGIFSDLTKMKYEVPNDKLERFSEYITKIDQNIKKLIS